jgi:hypothetical protein
VIGSLEIIHLLVHHHDATIHPNLPPAGLIPSFPFSLPTAPTYLPTCLPAYPPTRLPAYPPTYFTHHALTKTAAVPRRVPHPHPIPSGALDPSQDPR